MISSLNFHIHHHLSCAHSIISFDLPLFPHIVDISAPYTDVCFCVYISASFHCHLLLLTSHTTPYHNTPCFPFSLSQTNCTVVYILYCTSTQPHNYKTFVYFSSLCVRFCLQHSFMFIFLSFLSFYCTAI